MSIEYKEKLTIHVSRPQPYMALQEYTRQVLEAGRQGWEMTELMIDHARLSGVSGFSVTLGMGEIVSSDEDDAGAIYAGQDPSEVPVEESKQEGWVEQASQEVSEPPQESVPVDLDELKTKKDLLSYAKGLDIIIPKEHRSVISIRKYLKEA